MAAGHGGARPGAGRKPGSAKSKDAGAPTTRYDDALSYLAAVVRGDEPPDALRIAAAKSVLPYERPKRRAPVASPPPSAMRAAAEREGSAADVEDWNRRAAEVRSRLAKKGSS